MKIERMSAEEIRRNYREAKYKSKQLTILADMNFCKRADIKRIVTGEADELPPVRQGRGRQGQRLTEEERQEIIRLHLDGTPQSHIAAIVGRGDNTVGKIIRKYTEEKERENMVFAEEQTEQEREQLTAEIESQLEEQPSAVEEVDEPAPEPKKDAATVASALMDLLNEELRDYIVEIRAKADSYTVRVLSDYGEEIIHTKRRASHA